MLKVYRYNFKLDDYITIDLPKYAQILKFGFHNGSYSIWALVNPLAPHETRKFRLCGTGYHITENENELKYINTFFSGEYVWHVFEVER
jgi:hypothetical protein